MTVVMASRTLLEERAENLKRSGYNVLAYSVDVTQEEQVVELFKKIESDVGPLFALVNNAGILRIGPTVEMTLEDWNAVYNVNGKGLFLTCREAIKQMMPRGEGRIVNMSSIAGFKARTEQIGYSSVKAAAIHFTRCLAVEVAPYGITVNCSTPGMTETAMLSKAMKEHDAEMDKVLARIPSGRFSTTDEQAALISYFVSDEAANVTGQIVSVDGAQSLYFPFK
jgi:NAD(P)-dependent dehydrogenase (short-subunit alcohol dehydrogenase family)